jgi:hypothetical protein
LGITIAVHQTEEKQILKNEIPVHINYCNILQRNHLGKNQREDYSNCIEEKKKKLIEIEHSDLKSKCF